MPIDMDSNPVSSVGLFRGLRRRCGFVLYGGRCVPKCVPKSGETDKHGQYGKACAGTKYLIYQQLPNLTAKVSTIKYGS